jgi:GTP-binding protein HflX
LTPNSRRVSKSSENAFNKDLLQNDFLEKEKSMVDRTALIRSRHFLHTTRQDVEGLQVDLAPRVSQATARKDVDVHLNVSLVLVVSGFEDRRVLEIDRRLRRIVSIVPKQKIDDVQKQRAMHRRGRERNGLLILLVGYTKRRVNILNFLPELVSWRNRCSSRRWIPQHAR